MADFIERRERANPDPIPVSDAELKELGIQVRKS
jgi:hypothetical protein